MVYIPCCLPFLKSQNNVIGIIFLFRATTFDIRGSGYNFMCQKQCFQSLAQFLRNVSDMSVVNKNFDGIFVVRIFWLKIKFHIMGNVLFQLIVNHLDIFFWSKRSTYHFEINGMVVDFSIIYWHFCTTSLGASKMLSNAF